MIMSETHTHEWRELCLEALSEPNAERRTAIVVELGRILRKDVHKFGPLRVDVASAQVSQNGKPVYLTKLEFRLLRRFIERAGSDVSRDDLLRSVWGYESGACTRTVDIHVHFLRHKLEQDARHPQLIVTVPGVGYKFIALGAPKA
jgi:DNA-binding response OmpR family regulator